MTACTHYTEPAANYSIERPEPEPVKADAGAAGEHDGLILCCHKKMFFSFISCCDLQF